MTLVLAASPTARRDEGRFIAARGLSVQAPATPDPWSLYLGGKRWGDLARLVGFFPIFFFFFFCRFSSHACPLRAGYHDSTIDEIDVTMAICKKSRLPDA